MAESSSKQQRTVDIPQNIQIGGYAHDVLITVTPSDFVFTFVQNEPLEPSKAHGVSRVIMAPSTAKRLKEALEKQLGVYEEKMLEVRKEE